MFSKTLLQPDIVLGQTVLALTPERLQSYGLKGMILDVDETLVPFRQSETSDDIKTWLEQIKPLFSLWLVSNNTSETRIRTIAESMGVPYMAGALKPSRRKLRQALTSMNLPAPEVAMVGDRLFTDVIAGNRLDMMTIWVEPMEDDTNPASRQMLRNAEIWISRQLGVSLQAQA